MRPFAQFEQLVEDVTHFRLVVGSIPVSFYLLDEPANHPNITDMWRLLYAHGYGTERLNTNGGRIAREEKWQDLLNTLIAAGLRTVHLSVYGLEQTHDVLAGRKGAYRDLMACAERCTAVGLEVDWGFPLFKRNMAELTEAHTVAMEIAGPQVPFAPHVFNYAGRAREIEQERPTWADIRALGLGPHGIQEISGPVRSEADWVHQAQDGNAWRSFELHPSQLFPPNTIQLSVDDSGGTYAFLPHPLMFFGHLSEGLEALCARLVRRKFDGSEWLQPAGIMELGRRVGQEDNKRLHSLVSVWMKWLEVDSAGVGDPESR